MRGLFLAVATAVFLPLAVGAATAVGSAPAPGSQPVLDVSFTDAAGKPQKRPYFDVAGAAPGMVPEQEIVTIHNTGTMASSYDFSVVAEDADGGPSLAAALVVTVTRVADERVVYAGPLSQTSVSGSSPLSPGQDAAYVMTIEWPDRGAQDNVYQGRNVIFDIQARARQVDG